MSVVDLHAYEQPAQTHRRCDDARQVTYHPYAVGPEMQRNLQMHYSFASIAHDLMAITVRVAAYTEQD